MVSINMAIVSIPYRNKPAEFCQQEATLSLPDIPQSDRSLTPTPSLNRSAHHCKRRLRFRHLFEPAARKLL